MNLQSFDSVVHSVDRILAVDDQPDNLILLQHLLQSEGYAVDSVDNGRDALAEIERNPPDLLLLDLEMPIVNGYEVIRQIRQNPDLPFIPIVLMTAHGTIAALQGLELGANGCLCLPFNIEECLVKVRNFLQLKKSIASLSRSQLVV